MKIGIDLHGVADKYPAIVKPCLEAVRSLGVEVYFLSGPPRDEVAKDLGKLGYVVNQHYDHIVSVVDWLHTQDIQMWKDHKNTWWCDEEDWWASKAAICKERGITIVVDDCEKFKPYFGPEVTFILVGHEEIATHKTMRQWIQQELDSMEHGWEGVDLAWKRGRTICLNQMLDLINE